MAEHCTHERTRFPIRPVPDAWYVCPDCGEKVGRRGGRIITIHENNALAELHRPIYSRAQVGVLLGAARKASEALDGNSMVERMVAAGELKQALAAMDNKEAGERG